MKPTFFVLAALVFTMAPLTAVMADPDPQDAAKALEALKGDVKTLQGSQQPKHDADEAFDKAKKALEQNKNSIQVQIDLIKDGEKKNAQAKKDLQDYVNKHGGLAANPDTPDKLRKMDADWAKAKGNLTDEKTELETKRSGELQPAYDAAKKDKDEKDRAHDLAAKQADAAAKYFRTKNCTDKNGGISNVLGGIGRGLSSIVSGLSDDCKEVRGKLRSGLCKKEDLGVILSQVGIDAKSKTCGPVSGQTASPQTAPVSPAQ